MAENNKVVYVALVANAAIAISKFVAGIISGSSSLIAEGLHSTADTGDQAMVLLGKRLSQRPPDATHPFGHGKELYFWTLIVSVSMFTLGGLASIIEGIAHMIHSEPMSRPMGSYITLGIAFLFDGSSLVFSYRQLKQEKDPDESVAEGVKHAKDPTTFLVLFEDAAAVVGVVIAFVAVYLAHRLKHGWIDGLGAVGVGVVLMGVALFLMHEIRKLLIGERADPELLDDVQRIAQEERAVLRAERPRSMHFGPETVMVAMDAKFNPDVPSGEVAGAIDRVHRRIREKHPDVKYIYIQPTAEGASAGNGEKRAPDGRG